MARLRIAKAAPKLQRIGTAELLLPPFRIDDLPPGGMFGTFLGIAALKFATPRGLVFTFLHDLALSDLRRVLDGQREQAEAQLGKYAQAPQWWEKP